jgi:hypothetical protein
VTDFYFDHISQIRMDRRFKGRMGLVGDVPGISLITARHQSDFSTSTFEVIGDQVRAQDIEA